MPYKNREDQYAAAKRWKLKNREKYLASERKLANERYRRNRDILLQKSRDWQSKNKAWRSAYQRKYYKIRGRFVKPEYVFCRRSILKTSDIPAWLAEVYGLYLELRKEVRKCNHQKILMN